MRVSFNWLTQAAVSYFAWSVAWAHPGPPPTPSDWLTSISHSSCQEDLFEVVHRATQGKRPVEKEPSYSQSYSSGIDHDPHPTNLPDYSCSHQINSESFLLPSLEKRRKMGETHNDWTIFHPIFESHLPCSTATGDNIAGPSQDGHQDETLIP
ncbi:hypothetical protein PCASD_12252 [Puccinia coronata f. sp. avenae]|uniref:Uncharacterized protein n=1 Tax=Puccinia coronata f. sp. avenae TaxID=200324 RepID=A0A2N5T9G0_9BASI|nr:hypothetical protein PCASD_12252 [Puccinia coronata f. sp. avenae]